MSAEDYIVRNWTPEDIPGLVECHKVAYEDDYPPHQLFGQRKFEMQLEAFPEGQFLVEEKATGTIVGYALSLIVQLEDRAADYTYWEITGGETLSTHSYSGDTLYGADIAVRPDDRGKGIAGLLYEARKQLLRTYNLRRMIAYGRLPGFKEIEGKLTAKEYVNDVVAGRRKDPALNAHIKAGYHVERVRVNFMADPASLNYSTLLVMDNPDFDEAKRALAAPPVQRPLRRTRVCAAQYRMKANIKTWEQFEESVLFFVDTADVYHCHFLLFPECFTAQLFNLTARHLDERKAIEEIARMEDRYLELFTRLAKERQLYIIGGSHPIFADDGELYNVAHLFTPSGNVYTQDKLHITPGEREEWGIRPGRGINVFDTPYGRMAIQICYDVEFPETIRLLTFAGVEVLFVPFSTDERKAYYRVRYAAQARAVENMMYVVLSGNVGNLPNKYLLNYGQSGVFTPSDYGFPPHGIAAEADPNEETVAIADLDLQTLSHYRDVGAVRPLYDRRPDLYSLRPSIPINVIKVE